MPFLHITTRIPGHPHDDLLTRFGGRGFPTLAFLDAEGRKLMEYSGPRTTKGFEQALEEVQEFLDLEARAAAGEAKAATELLIRQLALQWFDFEEAKAKVEALTEVSSKQRKLLDQLLIDTEVRGLADSHGDSRSKRVEAGKRFLEEARVSAGHLELYLEGLRAVQQRMVQDALGHLPMDAVVRRFSEIWQDNELYAFWTFLADYAEDQGDKRLFKKVIKAYDDTLPNGASKNKAVKELERRLENM